MDGESKLLAVAVVLVAAGLAIRFRRNVLATVRRFFTEAGSPYDLAIFRIFFFATALATIAKSQQQDARLAQLPRVLFAVPTGMHWTIHVMYFSPGLVHAAVIMAIVASVTAAIGLWTRVSATVFLIAAFYFTTLPQLFQTGGHYHNVIWVAAVFAVSPSGDVLSVDAVSAAVKRARRSEPVDTPAPHVRYALPLRVIWLLMGLIYFFPGTYKYLHVGLQWASPANMSSLILGRESLAASRGSFYAVGRHDWLLWAMGLGTMLFEISFIFLVFREKTRWLAAAAGLIFHNMTNFVMSIPFWSLQILYVALVPWQRICERVFTRRGRLVFVYDPRTPAQLRAASVLRVIGLPDGVSYVKSPDGEGGDNGAIAVINGARVLRGYDAYRRLSWRVPVAWPILPLLYVPPFDKIGRAAFSRRQTLESVDSGGAEAPLGPALATSTRRRAGVVPVIIIGTVLIGGVVSSGLTGVRNGWPFSIYPAFDGKAATAAASTPARKHPTRVVYQVYEITAAGEKRGLNANVRLSWLPAVRRYTFIAEFAHAIATHPKQDELPRALWKALEGDRGGTYHVREIDVYRLVVSADPASIGRLVRRNLLARGPCVSCDAH